MDAADRPARADRQPAGTDRAVAVLAALEAAEVAAALSRYFGFAQFDLAGTLGLPDGRYLARDGAPPEEGGEDPTQRVLVVETIGTAPAPSRRRRRSQVVESGEPASLPLTRVTAVRAQRPFADPPEAAAWLAATAAEGDAVEALVGEGVGLLNRALHALAVAAGDPYVAEVDAARAVAVRIGFGSGDEVAESRFTEARHVDMRAGGSRRARREDELGPQARLAAVLGGRERIDACEPLLLRARADLEAGRTREAALQLRVALEALLVELAGALTDPGHEQDMAELGARRGEAGEAANAALHGDLDPERRRQVSELIELSERVLRRRRILRG